MSRLPATSASPPRLELDAPTLPADVRALVRRELADGERLVWIGQPIVRALTPATLVPLLFSIPWTAFALFWMWGASQASWLFALFGLPFVAVGVGMLTAPVWVARAARRTAYVITDRRAIVVRPSAPSQLSVRSFTPAELGSLERRERPDGSGDVVFTRDLASGSDDGKRTPEAGFLSVPDAHGVQRMLRALAAHARDTLNDERAEPDGDAATRAHPAP